MSIKAFSPNGEVSHQQCPVCLERNVKVEYGEEVEVIDGIAHGTGIQQKLWHCPNCGQSIATVIDTAALPEYGRTGTLAIFFKRRERA